jgi:ATP-dependent DNA helicase RecG
MTTEELLALVAEGETMTVEFKGEAKNSLSDRELYEAVVCLANAEGGVLLVGVEDDRQITGARERHQGGTQSALLQAAILNNTEPAVSVNAELISVDGNAIIVINIPKVAPAICSTRDGKCVRRIMGVQGPECQPYYPHQQQTERVSTGDVDYSAMPVGGTDITDLNPLEIERLRQTIKQKGGETRLLELGDEDLVKALGLVVTQDDHLVPNVAGVLLLGRSEVLTERIPTHQLAFQVIAADKEVRVNDWFREPLLYTLEQVESRFRNLNEEREADVGLVRLGIPDYSPDAFREALLNAVQHRNYAVLKETYVQLHADHLFIASPGGFPHGINLGNLLVHEPNARNGRLSEALRRIGLVETTGRGIDKIFYGQLRFGRGVPDYSRSSSDGVRVILMGGRESSQFAVFVAEQEKAGNRLLLDDLLVLDHLRHERRIDSELAGRLTQRGTNHGRSTLERLNERGLVEARGEKRGRVYHLGAAVYGALGLKGGYIRSKGFSGIRQKAMVLEFAQAHNHVARSDVMELCNLGGDQASRLLRNLAAEGLLRKVGERRGAHYVPPENG